MEEIKRMRVKGESSDQWDGERDDDGRDRESEDKEKETGTIEMDNKGGMEDKWMIEMDDKRGEGQKGRD